MLRLVAVSSSVLSLAALMKTVFKLTRLES